MPSPPAAVIGGILPGVIFANYVYVIVTVTDNVGGR